MNPRWALRRRWSRRYSAPSACSTRRELPYFWWSRTWPYRSGWRRRLTCWRTEGSSCKDAAMRCLPTTGSAAPISGCENPPMSVWHLHLRSSGVDTEQHLRSGMHGSRWELAVCEIVPRGFPRVTPETLCNQRIYHRHSGETPKIAVGGPELLDAVLQAQGRDTRVVHLWTHNFAGQQQPAQPFPVYLRFGEKNERRRLDPCIDLAKRSCERCRRREYFRMSNYCQEFVDAWPGNSPCRASLGEFRPPRLGGLMPFRVLAVRMDQ